MQLFDLVRVAYRVQRVLLHGHISWIPLSQSTSPSRNTNPRRNTSPKKSLRKKSPKKILPKYIPTLLTLRRALINITQLIKLVHLAARQLLLPPLDWRLVLVSLGNLFCGRVHNLMNRQRIRALLFNNWSFWWIAVLAHTIRPHQNQ